MLPEQLEEVLRNPREFRFGDYITDAFDIVKKGIGAFTGFFVLIFGALILGYVAILVPIIGIFATAKDDKAQLLAQLPLIGALFIAFLVAIVVLGTPLFMGAAIVAHRIKNGQAYTFSTFFEGFKDFGTLLTSTLLVIALGILCSAPYTYYMYNFFGGSELFTNTEAALKEIPEIMKERNTLIEYGLQIPQYIVSTLFVFSAYLIVFFRLGAIDALCTSVRLVMPKFGWIFIFNLVIGFISSFTVILCCIGLVVGMAFYVSSFYACFAQQTGLNDTTDIDTDDTTRHFVNL